ncbi:ATP-binding protein [Streptomyces sp. DSM 44917]|uniref:ATP-binding protein n=1 Tax=Streptomyces boetiae TaxID=3075541 RepID=A0ABU2L2Q5_9ACTN|nr:ATP-binding protein [Streptomyces sp. DSM 44917]MDT0305805.1 ATP-binding protein [Streptomyces sp. DSM 44917]
MIAVATQPLVGPLTLARAAQSAARARELVHQALGDGELAKLADAAALVVSEMVANSVLHGRCSRVHVTVQRTGRTGVRVVVADGSRALPVLRKPGGEDMGGRGLVIVEALAVRWGAEVLPWGKRVWAELAGGAA